MFYLLDLQCDVVSQRQGVCIERGVQPGGGDAAEVARDVQVAVALGQGGNAAVPLEDRPLGRVASIAAAASRRGRRPRPAPAMSSLHKPPQEKQNACDASNATRLSLVGC